MRLLRLLIVRSAWLSLLRFETDKSILRYHDGDEIDGFVLMARENQNLLYKIIE